MKLFKRSWSFSGDKRKRVPPVDDVFALEVDKHYIFINIVFIAGLSLAHVL